MVSAARSQNRTTLGSTTTRGTRREPLVESCGPIRANSRESLFCAILSSGRVRHAATHRSATSAPIRSEEHTSELQSQSNLVCRLLLEKKKNRSLLRELHRWQPTLTVSLSARQRHAIH